MAQAKAIIEAAPDDEGAMHEALMRLVQQKLFNVLVRLRGQAARKARKAEAEKYQGIPPETEKKIREALQGEGIPDVDGPAYPPPRPPNGRALS
ncbi:MAG: hypothetical protein ACLQAT_23300 [Candidatus Binataceae bacterium]